MKHLVTALSFVAVVGFASLVSASPFTVSSTLTGDPRAGNPDNIFVDVAITGDTTSAFTNWTVDVNSPLHADALLHEFYFNLLGSFDDYAFDQFDPSGWTVTGGANASGGGSIDFLFGADGGVTTDTLTFRAEKLTGNFTLADFLDAAVSCSQDTTLGCGQMGAHVGSLTAGRGESDSGFALGDYSTPRELSAVPEPASLTLLGSGLFAAASAVRRRRKAAKS